MRLLVTGATGLLGAEVARQCVAAGAEVRVLCRPRADRGRLAGVAVAFHVGDLTDADDLAAAAAGCEAILHCAGVTDEPGVTAGEMWRGNYAGTKVLVAVCQQLGVRRLVYTSSCVTVGGPGDGQVYCERDPYRWGYLGSAYHESKRAGEEVALRAADQGLGAVVVNPGLVFGRDERPARRIMRQLHEAAGRGRWLCARGGMSVTTAGRVAAGMRAALERGRRGQRYLLCGDNVSHTELVTAVARAHGRHAPLLTVGREASLPVAALSAVLSRVLGRRVGLTLGAALAFGTFGYYSSDLAARELGYAPPTMAEALAEFVPRPR
jgi:dihydroflavonol-4-reductase